MKKFLMFLCMLTLVFGGAGSASAAYYLDLDLDYVMINEENQSHTWNFDLDNDLVWELDDLDGIQIGTADIDSEDTINSAFFSMLFSDDYRTDKWYEQEYGDLTIDGNLYYDDEEIGLFDSIFIYDITSEMQDHKLSVTVDWVSGDFFAGVASVVGEYTSAPAPVPEPATIFLMGVGVLGMVGIRRRKNKK